ncbi:17572_t:CDS:10, partial [Cetraspora pellucida]
TPDGLRDVPTISSLRLLKLAIEKKGGTDNMYSYHKEYFERDGVVKLRAKGKWICLISDPIVVKNILLRPDTFPKLDLKEFSPIFSRHLGANVVHSNGDVWKRYRRVCNPAFKTLPIHLFNETGLRLLNVLERIDNKPIEVTIYQGLIRNSWINILPMERIPFWLNRAFKKIDKLDNLLDEIIKKKRKSIAAGKSNGDLLELMIKACEDPNNPTLSDIELRYNLAIFMFAGHETTSDALSTLLYILAVHKDIQQKAREEVTKIIGDSLTPSAEQLKSLKYLNMVIYENLRMYPSVTIFSLRKLTEDLKCKNHVIPTGTTIGIYSYGIHHSPKLWENPEKFIPERFENEHLEKLEFYGFGAGSRMCLGNNFSLFEQRIVICFLLRKYEISLAPNSIHKDGLKTKRMTQAFPIDLVFKRRNE